MHDVAICVISITCPLWIRAWPTAKPRPRCLNASSNTDFVLFCCSVALKAAIMERCSLLVVLQGTCGVKTTRHTALGDLIYMHMNIQLLRFVVHSSKCHVLRSAVEISPFSGASIEYLRKCHVAA